MQLNEAKKILNSHKSDLLQFGVQSFALFGSIAKNKIHKKSDIDILIDFDAKKGIFAFIDVKNYLETILERRVDLVTRQALHPALKKRILEEAKYIFLSTFCYMLFISN